MTENQEFADLPLTALQKTALERIRYFTRELKEKYGIYVRNAIELEFMAEDENHQPVPMALKQDGIHHAETYLRRILPGYIEKFNYEKLHHDGTPFNPVKYEVNVIDREHFFPSRRPLPVRYAPENVALATETLKRRTIASMLRETTCLNTETGLLPCFRARAFPEIEGHKYDTNGLHINMSLWDAEGNNLLSASPDLANQCALSLLRMQNNAAIALFPSPESLLRIETAHGKHGSAVARRTGLATHKPTQEDSWKSSIAMRFYTRDSKRLENRLPGADADPLVTTALTLAAFYDAVTKHLHPAPASTFVDLAAITIDNRSFHTDSVEPGAFEAASKPVSLSYEHTREKFLRSHHARELLGEALSKAIIKEYKASDLALLTH